MAFGDFARLDEYDPNATFPPTLDADEAAALRLARSVRRPSEFSEASIDKIAEGIPRGALSIAQALAQPIEKLTNFSRSRVGAYGGPMTELEATLQNQIGKDVTDYARSQLPIRSPLGSLAQTDMRGGVLFSGAERMRAPAVGANRVVRYPAGQPVVAEEPFHGFTTTRTGATPLEDMQSTIKGAPAFTRPRVKPEDLQGSEIIFTQGDRTRAGGKLTKVGDTKLSQAVPLEGGPDFPFAQSGLGWANAPAHSTQMLELGKSVAERGRDPVLMYLAMGKGSMDSAKQMAIPAVDMARQNGLSTKVVTELNTRMRGVDPDFPGWKSNKLDDWLRSTSGTNRASLVENLDSGWARAGGAPDLGELRYALTDPRLRTTPTGSVGLTVSKLDPASGIVPSRHTTYPTAVAGSGAGTMGGSIPWHVAAPDVHQWMLGRGPPVKFAERPAFFQERKPTDPTFPRTQLADQKWVDSVSNWIEKNPGMWAAGGAVPLGGLAAQDNYSQ